MHPALKSKRQKCSLVFLKTFAYPETFFHAMIVLSPSSVCSSSSSAAQPFSFESLCRSSPALLIQRAWWCLLLLRPLGFARFVGIVKVSCVLPPRGVLCVSVSIVVGVHFLWLLLIRIGV